MLVAEVERRHEQPERARAVEPFAFAAVERGLEVRRERERQAEKHGVRGRRGMVGVARGPGRNREPETEREARPFLPAPASGRHAGEPSKIEARAW